MPWTAGFLTAPEGLGAKVSATFFAVFSPMTKQVILKVSHNLGIPCSVTGRDSGTTSSDPVSCCARGTILIVLKRGFNVEFMIDTHLLFPFTSAIRMIPKWTEFRTTSKLLNRRIEIGYRTSVLGSNSKALVGQETPEETVLVLKSQRSNKHITVLTPSRQLSIKTTCWNERTPLCWSID